MIAFNDFISEYRLLPLLFVLIRRNSFIILEKTRKNHRGKAICNFDTGQLLNSPFLKNIMHSLKNIMFESVFFDVPKYLTRINTLHK